ncbi:Epidermal growth factor-like domain [Plasmopara halstedii]|uniref:Epidermal growth factor-like domain n=1 Tax=Plasmopara halstedii TaxID=4781 RepID=A0A0P1APH9_PLAHL|nr:Epidermal growth factor-like domain [Plasmopara halstedii]CEG42762.1 Epidermal growth factor-like domain [Plasmopara halstedii]|eukprot:XP_024579131.1 Epidermal growth factor-like domain [Plasmopara halstedii]
MNAIAYIAAIAAVCTTAEAASGSGQPGYCKNDDSCEDNYVCISVQTTRSGIEDVKQCLPYEREGDVCSGTFPGLCPSFSTWKTAFQSISSVCAYQLPSGTDQCLNDSFSGSNTDGYVSCMDMTAGSGSEAVTAGVIFACVDFDGSNLLFDEDSDNYALSREMNYTGVINEGCVNPNNAEDSDVVCSGRGTCTPDSPGSRQFYCECNVGYNGTYCQGIESNKCTLESQCQAGTCNLTTQECECEEGTTGDQCAFCDPSSSKACNGRGSCVAAPSVAPGGSNTTSAPSGSAAADTNVTGSDANLTMVGSVDQGVSSTRFLQTRTANSTSSMAMQGFVQMAIHYISTTIACKTFDELITEIERYSQMHSLHDTVYRL